MNDTNFASTPWNVTYMTYYMNDMIYFTGVECCGNLADSYYIVVSVES